ncbi:DUF6119 family protein [Actinocrispum sp. NPDC049592]|uniref:DUF6119 family protein n=1 Tax=Actinocrispum sp. NPDC049592 TaxID=3154835 RepID=UPI003427E5D8
MKLSVHLLLDTLVAQTGPAPRRESLVPDFGIRVAANSLYLPSIGLDHEWFRALAHDGLVRGMTGSHIVHVEDPRLPVPELLAELRSRYLATRYRSDVPLLDILHPVRPDMNVVAQLDLTLEHRVRTGLHVGLDWAVEAADGIRAFRIHGDGVPPLPTDRPTLNWVREYLAQSASARVPRLRVDALDQHGNVVHTKPLRECVSAELWHRGEFYVLADGRWFLVDRAHLAHLEGELGGLPDVTAELAQRTFVVSLPHHADLLTEEMDLVFTKKTFARGSQTAKRYRERAETRAELAGIHRRNWPAAPAREPRFVYALAGHPGTLPFFSKVTLLHHVDRIRAEEFEVAVARHPLPAVTVPSPRTEGLPLRDPI